ncbi:MAG: ParB/Sulfiredoxin [Monoraphidium minutum]|nr:MAG: ParB/Sulfiredoxin [Monoraphidium minutum]
MFQFHTSESAASLASSLGDDGLPRRDEAVLDSGIKLPPGAELMAVQVDDLRPTQLAVGMQQVGVKMAKARKKAAKGPAALDAWLRAHPIPVVLGPGQAMYLIDHHHLSRALHELGIKTCYAGVARDFSGLEPEAFWAEMAAARCLWPYDHGGAAVPAEQLAAKLPATVAGLQDDPYRSLAALVRKSGGFVKSTKPFSEFMWANFLRPRVPLALETHADVTNYVGRALSHATSPAAAHLPGHTPLDSMGPAQLDAMADQGGLAPAADDDGGGEGDGKTKEAAAAAGEAGGGACAAGAVAG